MTETDRTCHKPSGTKSTLRRAEAQTQQEHGGWGHTKGDGFPLHCCTYTEGVHRGINQVHSSLPHHRHPKGQLNLLSSPLWVSEHLGCTDYCSQLPRWQWSRAKTPNNSSALWIQPLNNWRSPNGWEHTVWDGSRTTLVSHHHWQSLTLSLYKWCNTLPVLLWHQELHGNDTIQLFSLVAKASVTTERQEQRLGMQQLGSNTRQAVRELQDSAGVTPQHGARTASAVSATGTAQGITTPTQLCQVPHHTRSETWLSLG